MNSNSIDREELKSVLTEVLAENPSFFKSILTEILEEHKVIETKENSERASKIRKMIQEDFDRYDQIFKSLA